MSTQVWSTTMLKLLTDGLARNRAESSPPGPGLVENALFHLEFVQDQIDAYWSVIDEYGPVVRLWIGPYDMFLVTEPDLIEEILVDKPRKFHKDVVSKELEILLGRGLLISDGELWRRQRKLVAPPLQRKQIAHYADVMVSETERMIGKWEDGETRRFDRDIQELTLRIAVQTLFDLEMEGKIETVADAIDDTMEFIDQLRHSPWRFVPDPIPTPKERQFEEAKAKLDAIIYDLIDRRRRRDEPGDDLLYRLLKATNEAGNQMSDEQLRDEVITLFLAGHETTALALTYGWYLVSRHPRVADRLQREVDEVIGDDRPGVEHARELPYAEAIFKESMRLYPPAWAIGRQPIEEVDIGDYTIPEGSQVMMPQCVVHRDERWYDAPDAFRPERWLDDLEDELPRFGYFPFGGGPRICVGNHFAKMEGVLAIATMAKHCEFDPVAPEEMETYTSITQRPEDPVELTVRFR